MWTHSTGLSVNAKKSNGMTTKMASSFSAGCPKKMFYYCRDNCMYCIAYFKRETQLAGLRSATGPISLAVQYTAPHLSDPH